MSNTEITATEVRFIKLGGGGSWEQTCIEGQVPTVRFGFDNPLHNECLSGDWDKLRDFWSSLKPKQETTKIINQTRDFYELGPDALWITFYQRKLWWCFADTEVKELQPAGNRVRNAINGWKCEDTSGRTLYVDDLSGRLTKVQGYRGTICKVKERDYLLARLNSQAMPEVETATLALSSLKKAAIPLIRQLNWKDFELLVDLLFSRAGWQRLSTLGKTEKHIDLDLMSPVTGRRAFVQVKSTANLESLKSYINQFHSMDQYQEMFFVVHSPTTQLASFQPPNNVMVMGPEELASLVVSSGVTSWLIKKAS